MFELEARCYNMIINVEHGIGVNMFLEWTKHSLHCIIMGGDINISNGLNGHWRFWFQAKSPMTMIWCANLWCTIIVENAAIFFCWLTFYLIVVVEHLNVVTFNVDDGYEISGYCYEFLCILICSIVRVISRFYVYMSGYFGPIFLHKDHSKTQDNVFKNDFHGHLSNHTWP